MATWLHLRSPCTSSCVTCLPRCPVRRQISHRGSTNRLSMFCSGSLPFHVLDSHFGGPASFPGLVVVAIVINVLVQRFVVFPAQDKQV